VFMPSCFDRAFLTTPWRCVTLKSGIRRTGGQSRPCGSSATRREQSGRAHRCLHGAATARAGVTAPAGAAARAGSAATGPAAAGAGSVPMPGDGPGSPLRAPSAPVRLYATPAAALHARPPVPERASRPPAPAAEPLLADTPAAYTASAPDRRSARNSATATRRWRPDPFPCITSFGDL
jgi:hypothetical protein